MEQELLKAIREVMKEELKPIKAELEGVKADVKGMNGRFDTIEGKLEEHTQILQALMHSSEVNAAHRDKMANDIAHIKGEVTGIKGEITELRADMNQVEIVTSRNWNAIAKIKAVKND